MIPHLVIIGKYYDMAISFGGHTNSGHDYL